jgi:hypothetical protein
MQLVKFALIAGACGVVWYNAVRNDHPLFPNGITGLTGFYLVVLTSFTGVIRAASLGAVIDTMVNFTQCFVFLWTLYIFYTRGGNVVRVFRNAAIIIVLFSIPPLTNWFFGVPGWSYSGENPLWSTGFTNKRSGWSQGLAFYLPILAALPFFSLRKKAFTYLLSLGGIAILLASQFITGGRSGLLASMVVLAALSMLLLPRRVAVVLLVALVSIGGYFSDFAYEHLRFHRFTEWSYESINEFSSYRLEDYVAAYDLFWARPLGHGFGQSVQILMREYQQSTELHNVWLRLLADGGVLLLISSLGVVVGLLSKSTKAINPRVLNHVRMGMPIRHAAPRRQLLLVVCLASVLGGLSISMFAPRTPIGVFQNSAMWWGSAGAIVGLAATSRRSDTRRRASTHGGDNK